MFETSKDILNLSIAFSVVLVAGFFSWMLYYIIAMLRDTRAMVTDVRKKMEAIENAVQSIRSRVEGILPGFAVLVAGVKEVISYVMEKRRGRAVEDDEEERPRKKK
jgi:uncharacterized protein YoxC